MTERYDGDDRESRTAFRAYDSVSEPVSGRTPWQIWRDSCAWQAARATPADTKGRLIAALINANEKAARAEMPHINVYECIDIIRQLDCATPADQVPLGWAWERRYSNGGYTRRFCATEDEARELAKDGESLGSPDLVYPFFVRATPADHSVPVARVVNREPYLDGSPHPGKTLDWRLRGCEDDLPVGTELYIAPQPPQNAADHIVDANKKVDADHSSPQFEAVKNAGSQLANCAFNLAQRPGEKLSLVNCKTLDTCRKDWDAAIHALKDAQSVRDEWIPVSERLPEQHEWVLVSDGTWSAIGTHLDDEDLEPSKRWMDESAELIESNGIKITHWMPMPAPPQKPVSDEVKP